MSRIPNNTNHRLPLSQDARLAVLAKVDAAKLGLTARVWLSVRLLIEAIELSTTRDGAVIQLRVLATKCRVDRRTILRAADRGRRAGILSWTQERDDEGRQAANRWTVAWDRLAGLAGRAVDIASIDGRAADHDRGPSPTRDQFQSDSPTVTLDGNLSLWKQNCHSGTLALPLTELNLKQTSSYLPETTSVGSSGERPEEVLFSLGVDQALRACGVAHDQGCGDAHIFELIAHWRLHGGGQPHAAWQPAGLYWRICHARPNVPADRGWPRPSSAWQRALEQAATAKATAAAVPRTEPSERFSGSMAEEFQQMLRDRRAAARSCASK